MPEITLRQLRAFQAVMTNGSINAAAERLHLTQPAVSKQLTGLEEALKISLFHRGSGRSVTPTSEGLAFYKAIEPTLENLGNLSTIASEVARRTRPRLRFGAPTPMLNSPPIIQALHRCKQDNPGVVLSLEQRTRLELEDWMVSRQIDLAFGLLPVENPLITAVPLIMTEAVAAVSPDHRLATRQEICHDDLIGEPLILPSRQLLRNRIDVGLWDLQGQVVMEPTSSLSCPAMAASGLGVAVCDPFSVSIFSRKNVITLRLRPRIPLEYGVLHQKESTPDDVIQALIELIRDELEKCDVLPRCA